MSCILFSKYHFASLYWILAQCDSGPRAELIKTIEVNLTIGYFKILPTDLVLHKNYTFENQYKGLTPCEYFIGLETLKMQKFLVCVF